MTIIDVRNVTPVAIMTILGLALFLMVFWGNYKDENKDQKKADKSSKPIIIILSILIVVVAFIWGFALKTAAGKKMFKGVIDYS